MKIKANNANSPIWKDVYSHSKLPQQLEPLNEIATNLWWVWNHEGAKLFGKIDKQLWKSTEGNPVQLLQSLSHKRMEEILADKELMAEIQKVYADFKAYINVKPDKTQPSVAYFSMEYGLTNVLKIYSGGLGVLAGDYLKEASKIKIESKDAVKKRGQPSPDEADCVLLLCLPVKPPKKNREVRKHG